MSNPIIWIHEDCLNPNHPAVQKYPQASSIFVFDSAYLKAEEYSKKRVHFIYESLLETSAVIRKGDTADTLLAFAKEKGAHKIATTASVSPTIRKMIEELKRSIEVETLEVEPFVDYQGRLDLKRFSRYWQRVQQLAFGR
jgi:hypothetical protein